MAYLGPSASADQIYEELAFLEICEYSLDPGADDYHTKLAELKEKNRQCVERLDSERRSSPVDPALASDLDDTELEEFTASMATLSPTTKRSLVGGQSSNRHAKRRTPEPSRSSWPSSSSSSTPRDSVTHTAASRARDNMRMRQEVAEAQLRRQRAAHLLDEQLARSLSQQQQPTFQPSPSTSSHSSQSSSHHPSNPYIQTTLGRNGSFTVPRPAAVPAAAPTLGSTQQFSASQSTVDPRNIYQSHNRPAATHVKPEYHPQNIPMNHGHPNPQSSQAAFVDLTGSDSGDEVQIQNRGPMPPTTAYNPQSNFAAHTMPGAWPGMQPGQTQYANNPTVPPGLVPNYPAGGVYIAGNTNPFQSNFSNGFQAVRSIGSKISQLGGLIGGSASQPHNLYDDDADSDDDDFSYQGMYRRGAFTTSNYGQYYGQEDLYRSRYDAIANYDPAKTQEEIQSLLENIRPDEDMPAHLRVQTPTAMAVQLHKYQELGLTWLQKCETGTNKGGILADDMGLGKTIQMLSLIVTHSSEDPTCRTTLIVAPVALMRQWKQEIEQKVKPGSRLSVHVHHGSAKKANFSDLRHYDVVLTTFGSVAAEVKKMEAFRIRQQGNPTATPTAKEKCVLIGPDALWYRVILDEAQCIKNKNTKTAKGANMIRAMYRFCMTGTPMMNNVDELFSLISFLKIKPYNSWEKFRMDISQPLKAGQASVKKQAMQRLQTLCKAIMLRRTKKSTFEGKPILILPERVNLIDNPVFNEDERAIYDALEQSTALQFNKYFKEGTAGTKYSAILLLLLRLRQACCHPHLVRDFGVAAAADVTPEQMLELAELLEPQVIARIKQKQGVFECPICFDAATNPAIFIPCGHDSCAECFAKITDPAIAIAAGNEHGVPQTKCPNCRNPIDPKKITDFESFKRVHQPELLTVKEREELEGKDDSDSSDTEGGDDDDSTDESSDDDEPDTNDPTLGGFIVNDDEPIDESSDTEEDDDLDAPFRKAKKNRDKDLGVKSELGVKEEAINGELDADVDSKAPRTEDNEKKKIKKSKSKSKGKQKANGKENKKTKKQKKKEKKAVTLGELKKRASRSVADKKKYLRRLREDWMSSAKIDKTLEILTEIMNDGQGEKVLIFSQWTSFLDLLEVPIDENGWKYRRYDGSMNATMRSNAIDEFRDPRADVRIMLVSLKAGNAGLNLNMASQVIILDPFWNPFIEEQAIDRAHRLGQTREVTVHRVLVPDTVEDRICKLQEDKRELIAQALDERAGQSISRLGLQELSYLFGLTRTLRPSASSTGNGASAGAGAGAGAAPSSLVSRTVGPGAPSSSRARGAF